jgi:hypothetical protein
MGWDNTIAAGARSLFERTQEPAGSGAASYYKNIASRTAAGSQPNASTTPVYLDEYNDNWWFGPTCCRNSFTYSPVFNTLYIADMLNTVYDAVPAANTPGKVYYYAASAFPYFCMLGSLNTKMDCAAVAFQGYPQFYAYTLLASTNYLGLSEGGYMAKSVSPLTTPAQGLVATAFYTSSADVVVIINPSNINYTGISVQLDNTGFGSAQGTLYLLNDANRQITSSSISLSANGSGFQATVDVPAYSVVAIRAKP